MITRAIVALVVVCASAFASFAQSWAKAEAPVISNADPYVAIPGAALAPTRLTSYSAVFDATRMAKEPTSLVPALNAAGGLLNDLAVGGTPIAHTHFVVVFHGAATDGILDNAHYKAKYGIDNPNLAAITKMKSRGVQFFVCGQHLAANNIDPATLSKDVTVAADAFLVLISFQNKGFGVMFF
jgi:intracellular sulfur oxidation DsrE/DsrF family protein